MDDNASFGYWIRRRRKALDLTQATLARQVGCSTGMIRMIEADARRPSRQMAELLADRLEVPDSDRAAFVRAARAEISVDRLAMPVPATAGPAPRTGGPRQSLFPPPPIAHLEGTPLHNPPAPSTLLIGREQAVANVCALLRGADVRLVTLHGPGGIGKTRLALEVGTQLLSECSDGVWFVDLAPIRDPALVTSAIAHALDITQVGDEPLVDRLTAYLRDKQLLLVLDNFEQVIAAAGIVAALIRAARHLTVLVTSREVLHLSGEHEVAVPPLDLPDRRQLPPPDILRQYAAVALFIQRAQAVTQEFQLTDETAAAIVHICARLDGLPLAIELAAARSKLFSPPALLARLDSPLRLLTVGVRDLHVHQQTLRSTIDWSYHLLDASEQILFARLAVFVGGCTLEAAEAVCTPGGALGCAVLDGLGSLVDKSLVQQHTGADSEPCFTMLATLREYALERLTERDEEQALRDRHLLYFCTLAEEADPHLRSHDQVRWLDRLDREQPNLRAALERSLSSGQRAVGIRLATAIMPFWHLRSYYREGDRWWQLLLATDESGIVPADALALSRAAWTATMCGDTRRAQKLGDQAIAMGRAAGDSAGLASALTFRSDVEPDADRRVALAAEAVALARQVGDTWLTAEALVAQGDALLARDEHAGAAAVVEAGLALFRHVGDSWGIWYAAGSLAIIAHAEGRYDEAQVLQEERLAMSRRLSHSAGMASTLVNLADLAMERGDYAGATALLTESARRFGEAGQESGVVWTVERSAWLAELQGDYRRAVRLLAAVESIATRMGGNFSPTFASEYKRTLAAARTQLGEAAWQAAWAEGRAMTLEQAVAYALEETATFP